MAALWDNQFWTALPRDAVNKKNHTVRRVGVKSDIKELKGRRLKSRKTDFQAAFGGFAADWFAGQQMENGLAVVF